jgi:hypothetical protein
MAEMESGKWVLRMPRRSCGFLNHRPAREGWSSSDHRCPLLGAGSPGRLDESRWNHQW